MPGINPLQEKELIIKNLISPPRLAYGSGPTAHRGEDQACPRVNLSGGDGAHLFVILADAGIHLRGLAPKVPVPGFAIRTRTLQDDYKDDI